MINSVYLKTFVTLAETRHFTKTAEKLFMTQPGVSQHINKLEAQLATQLLHRYGKQFELTEAGEHLLAYGQKQLSDEQALMEYLQQDDRYSGECRLACSGALAMKLYPLLLNIQPQHPGLTFSLEAAPNSGIIQRLLNNHCELGIVTQQISDPALQQDVLGEDELCLVLPAQEELCWQNLIKLGFVNHPDGHHYANTLLAANFQDNFSGLQEIPQSSYINQLSQILLPVSMGLGFTVVPKSCLNAFSNRAQIKAAQLASPVIETLYLTSKRHRPLGQRYELVKKVLDGLWG